jgi:hypothetical protein
MADGVTVTIPADLAERVRALSDVAGSGAIASLVHDIAALLPEPDPLDVLAATDGWEKDADNGTVSWMSGGDYVYCRPNCVVPALAECDSPAAAVRLAVRLREAIEDERS